MNNLDSLAPKFLSLLRFITGLLFLEHGLQKILHFPPMPAGPSAAAQAAAAKALAAAPADATVGSVKDALAAAAKAASHGAPWFVQPAGFIELIGGLLITIGLFTRYAAFIASGEMAFAYFMVHAKTNFYPVNNQGDAAILYCFTFLFLVFAGPGPFALDSALRKKA